MNPLDYISEEVFINFDNPLNNKEYVRPNFYEDKILDKNHFEHFLQLRVGKDIQNNFNNYNNQNIINVNKNDNENSKDDNAYGKS